MKKDRFAWWRQRFEHMAFCFDAFRIDHVLGFFRIWSIPMDAVEGILGHFEPALPVRVAEFARRGISFDYERFVRPWISDEVLKEIFGAESVLVKRQFLQIDFRGRFTLKPEFATQRQVQEYFEKANPAANSQKLRQGLLDLISNVILLEVEGPEGAEFHFRFGVEETWSFKHLDTQTQARLKELYLDYFFRRQEAFWKREGMEKLPALKRVTNLLICGEDLGMVPACVPEVMKQLGLLSLEIQRMPKALNADFSRPAEAPYLSVVTPSTHDMSTIRGWWEEDDTVTRKFYQQELGATGEPPKECSGAMNQTIVEQHLASPAMLSIFQLQDLLGMDESLRRPDIQGERINIPADPRHYWRYRMHLTLEDLLRADAFNDQLLALIRKNDR
jgi:4-alpha-glucanotransferase